MTRIVVETNDGFVLEIYDDEDCEEWRLDVCQVVWMPIDGVGTGIDDENDGGVLEHHLVDGGGWKIVEGAGIDASEGDGSWLMLRWILDSTVFFICCIISSGLKDTLDPGCVDGGATGGRWF